LAAGVPTAAYEFWQNSLIDYRSAATVMTLVKPVATTPVADTDKRYRYLGAKQRLTALPSGAITMGARVYVPQIGRFLQVDPVIGGSANDYDYAFQDPVNQFDLDGRCPVCVVGAVVAVRAAYTGYKTYRAVRAVKTARTTVSTVHDVARTRASNTAWKAATKTVNAPVRAQRTVVRTAARVQTRAVDYGNSHRRALKTTKIAAKVANEAWKAYKRYKGVG
jgi:RHS repeat-associated protein